MTRAPGTLGSQLYALQEPKQSQREKRWGGRARPPGWGVSLLPGISAKHTASRSRDPFPSPSLPKRWGDSEGPPGAPLSDSVEGGAGVV